MRNIYKWMFFSLGMVWEKVISYILLVISVVLLIFVVSYNTGVEPKQGITELYFGEDIPQTLKKGEKVQSTFYINNKEDADKTYTYTLTAQNSTVSNAIFVRDGEQIAVPFTIQHQKTETIKVAVSLDSGESIHVWINVK